MTTPDMARVWVSLVHGEQLNEEWAAYLLDLANETRSGCRLLAVPVRVRSGRLYLRPEGGVLDLACVGWLSDRGQIRAARGRLRRGLHLRLPDLGERW